MASPRLARNVHFISGLMESGVEFVAVDLPSANRLTLHILAAVAEHEREAISERTRAALRAAREQRGVRLGNPTGDTSRATASAAAKAAAFRATVLPAVRELAARGMSRRGIARELNRRGMRTLRGKAWGVQQVSRMLDAGDDATA